jgi:hypothetical protein
MARLDAIENDLAERQNDLEAAAMDYARAKRDYEREYATAFLGADGNVEERRQRARLAVKGDLNYAEAQGKYEGLKAVVRVLDTRASVAQSVLKAQSR